MFAPYEAAASISSVRTVLGAVTADIDADVVLPADARAAIQDLAVIQSLAHVSMTLLARRVAETDLWREGGHRSPEQWLAAVAGIPLGDARRVLATSKRIEDQPATGEAARSGRVSPDKLHDISDAAAADPAAESSLLDGVEDESVSGVRDRCRRAKAAAGDDIDRHQRARESRRVWTHLDAEGAGHLDYRDAPDRLAEIVAALDHFRELEFAANRARGQRSSWDHTSADALVAMARAALANARRGRGAPEAGPGTSNGPDQDSPDQDSPDQDSPDQDSPDQDSPDEDGPDEDDPPKNGSTRLGSDEHGPGRSRRPNGSSLTSRKIIVRVDHAALLRGHTEPGETCEIAGLGPVPVATVREMLDDAFLAAVVTRGVDIVNVAHLGRRFNAHQMTALQWAHTSCTRLGCNNTVAIQIDHRTPWVECRTSEVSNADPLCPHCHYLKTHQGFRLEPGSGRRRLLSRHDPDPPTPVAGPPPDAPTLFDGLLSASSAASP